MKEFLVYTGLRLALLVGALGLITGIWFLVADEVPLLWALVLAFIVSGIGSYYLLDRQRAAFGQRVEERAARATARFEESKSREDVD